MNNDEREKNEMYACIVEFFTDKSMFDLWPREILLEPNLLLIKARVVLDDDDDGDVARSSIFLNSTEVAMSAPIVWEPSQKVRWI